MRSEVKNIQYKLIPTDVLKNEVDSSSARIKTTTTVITVRIIGEGCGKDGFGKSLMSKFTIYSNVNANTELKYRTPITAAIMANQAREMRRIMWFYKV